jgi:hypothetical protein
MTIGAVLDTTLRLYGQNFFLMLGLTALPYVPYLVFLLSITVLMPQITSPLLNNASLARILILVVGLIPLVILPLVTYPLSAGAATYAISQRYLRHQTSAGEALKAAWQRYGTMAGATIMVGIIMLLATLLLVVPGILCGLSYALLYPVIMLEARHATESRQRSWELVAGFRGKIFKVFLVIGLLCGLINIGVKAILDMALDPNTLSGELVVQVVTQSVALVLTPLATIAGVLLYYDLRIRKEGFDLEMLSRAFSTR